VFQAPAGQLKPFVAVDPAQDRSAGLSADPGPDEPGVIAAISETLAEAASRSTASCKSRSRTGRSGVPIVLTTHATPESVLDRAISRIEKLPLC
jgi:homoserine dehydrogenase